jgi:hypothetical protein
MNYSSYITSTEWRSKHKEFLKKSHYRCAFFPWVKVGRKGRYNVHHMNYRNLGNERLWVDVICLSPFAHSFIIHGVLSGFRRPSQQKKLPKYGSKVGSYVVLSACNSERNVSDRIVNKSAESGLGVKFARV